MSTKIAACTFLWLALIHFIPASGQTTGSPPSDRDSANGRQLLPYRDSANARRSTDTALRQLPSVWDLQTCLDYAKKNNLQLASLRLTEKTSEQEYLLAQAARYPNLNGTMSHAYTHSRNVNPVVGGFQTQSSFSGTYSLGSNVTIYNGGLINNTIKERSLEVQSANLNIVQSENDITLEITQAYLNILLAKENIIYIKDLLNTTQAQVDQGQKQYDAGSIARNALIELQAQLANDKYTMVTAKNTERQNKLTLKQLLQLPTDVAFDILSPDTVITTTAVLKLDETESIALKNRPEIKNGQIGVEIARFDLRNARTGYLPALTGSGALSTGYSNNQSSDYFSQLDNNFFQQVGLTLSIPIFNNRVNKTNVENAKIAIEQTIVNLKNTQMVLAQAIEQAYINVLNAQGQYDAAVEELNATKESYRVAGEELKVGAVNTVDYLQQKTLYTQAFQAYIQAKYNTALNVRIYDFYAGVAIKL